MCFAHHASAAPKRNYSVESIAALPNGLKPVLRLLQLIYKLFREKRSCVAFLQLIYKLIREKRSCVAFLQLIYKLYVEHG